MAGLGVASTQILPPIAALPYIKITAAADLRGDALEKFREAYRGETFTSVEALCESPNVDAVYIATPSQLHARHTIAASKRAMSSECFVKQTKKFTRSGPLRGQEETPKDREVGISFPSPQSTRRFRRQTGPRAWGSDKRCSPQLDDEPPGSGKRWTPSGSPMV